MNPAASEAEAGFRPAGLLARALALGLDVFLAGAFAVTAAMIASGLSLEQLRQLAEDLVRPGSEPSEADRAKYAEAIRALWVVMAAAPLAFAWSVVGRGASPGKALLALSVRDFQSGKTPGFGRALAREALRLVHLPLVLSSEPRVGVAGMFVWIAMTLDTARQRASRTWYDRLTRTIVVVPAELVEPPDDPR